MKSKSGNLILILVILLVVVALVYFFVIRDKGTSIPDAQTGLVSSNTGASQGLQNTVSAETGSQVVVLLRNLTAIKLDDSVFRNPSFALLTDMSVSLPPVSDPGRRNPFAPIGIDAPLPTIPVSTPTTPTSTSAGGPSF